MKKKKKVWYTYTVEYYPVIRKNNVICSNMDGLTDYYTKTAKHKHHMVSLMCGIFKNVYK